jgi:protein-tyrosine phosphatase
LAEALLKQRLGAGKQIFSAGTGALVGRGADPLSIEVGKEHGLDLSTHRAQQLILPMLEFVEVVLTLDESHNQWVNQRYPTFRGKVHKLGKWNQNRDIPDPYRHPKAAFDYAYKLIDESVLEWQSKLR